MTADVDWLSGDLEPRHLVERPKQYPTDPIRPEHRSSQALALATTVAGERRVWSQHRHEAVQLTLLAGREESLGQLVALSWRRVEPWSVLLELPTGPYGDLPAVRLALRHDRRDFLVRVAEHVMQQEHGPLVGGQPLEDE